MIALVKTAVCLGITAYPIQVETDVGPGLPQFIVVGLPDQSLKECRERVRSAIKNSGFDFPPDKIIVNLSPADLRKEGPAFDLAIALGILTASGQIEQACLDRYLFLGELALDGSIRPVRGVIATVSGLKSSNAFICPNDNISEACLEKDAEIYGASNLAQVIGFLKNDTALPQVRHEPEDHSSGALTSCDFSEVKGQAFAKRALEIAVAGGHNILLIGPPGSGKSMLSQRIPSILPPLNLEEKIELTKIYSVAGLMQKPGLVHNRPFRSPHHSISLAALTGGGSTPRPGEVSLAHHGVLFLDEFPEFRKDVIESLRAPMEDGQITVSRAKSQVTYPCNFMLAAAMNPCPCGYLGHPKKSCLCPGPLIRKYQSKISGPILDRIDLHVEVPALPFDALTSESYAESSESILRRILACRKIQQERFKASMKLNSGMRAKDLREFTKLDSTARKLMEAAVKEMGFSARSYYKILKISRTIADLEGQFLIGENHLAEALQYRSLDRMPV